MATRDDCMVGSKIGRENGGHESSAISCQATTCEHKARDSGYNTHTEHTNHRCAVEQPIVRMKYACVVAGAQHNGGFHTGQCGLRRVRVYTSRHVGGEVLT